MAGTQLQTKTRTEKNHVQGNEEACVGLFVPAAANYKPSYEAGPLFPRADGASDISDMVDQAAAVARTVPLDTYSLYTCSPSTHVVHLDM